MDKIEFRKQVVDDDHVAGILINGVPLARLAEDHEVPRYELKSNYLGLPLSDVAPPAGHFRGEAEPHYDYHGRIQVLGCNCGIPGCWPLVCVISTSADTVTWSDFRQPFRDVGSDQGHWSYDGFGPFTFDRVQYEAALVALAPA